jgi:hypothetical protein
MKKTIIRGSVLFALVAVLFGSCASMYRMTDPKKVTDPGKAYIAFKVDVKKQKGFQSGGKPSIEIATSAGMLAKGTKRQVGYTEKSLYRLVEVPAGSYRMWNPEIASTSYVWATTKITRFQMPPEVNSIFRVNPGEIVYAGDYTFEVKGDERLNVELNMDACRESLVKENPFLDGFVWVSFLAERDSL